MQRAIEVHTAVTGDRPLGWYTGRTSPNTRKLVVEEGGFLYDADDYNDELPYWTVVGGQEHLIVPYSLDANDMRFAAAQGFNAGDQFYNYLKTALTRCTKKVRTRLGSCPSGCIAESSAGPAGLHPQEFVDYALSHQDVWFCRRIDIARH